MWTLGGKLQGGAPLQNGIGLLYSCPGSGLYLYFRRSACVRAHIVFICGSITPQGCMFAGGWGWHRHGHFQTDTDTALPIKVKIERNTRRWLLLSVLLSTSVHFTKDCVRVCVWLIECWKCRNSWSWYLYLTYLLWLHYISGIIVLSTPQNFGSFSNWLLCRCRFSTQNRINQFNYYLTIILFK